MGSIAVSNKVIMRNSIGQFIEECRQAGPLTMHDVGEKGAELSRGFAPRGKKPDPRTPALHNAIYNQTSGTVAKWVCIARHAVIVELTGSVAHTQSGDVSFFWEKEGRMWHPGKNAIDHPSTSTKPYLRPAYEIMMQTWSEYARRYYPQ